MTAIFRIFRPHLTSRNLFKMPHIVDHNFYAQKNNYLRIVTGRQINMDSMRERNRAKKMQQ